MLRARSGQTINSSTQETKMGDKEARIPSRSAINLVVREKSKKCAAPSTRQNCPVKKIFPRFSEHFRTSQNRVAPNDPFSTSAPQEVEERHARRRCLHSPARRSTAPTVRACADPTPSPHPRALRLNRGEKRTQNQARNSNPKSPATRTKPNSCDQMRPDRAKKSKPPTKNRDRSKRSRFCLFPVLFFLRPRSTSADVCPPPLEPPAGTGAIGIPAGGYLV